MNHQVSLSFSATALELNSFHSELLKLKNEQKPLLQKADSPYKLILRMKKRFEKA